MKKSFLLRAIVMLGFAGAGMGQRKELALPSGYPYSAAFISTISAAPGHTELVVFPFRGAAYKIPLRSTSVPRTFGPDGKTLYGPCTPFPVGPARPDEAITVAWCKIDLKTGGTTPVPGTVHDFFPHGDRIPSAGLTRLFGSTRPIGNLQRYLCQPTRTHGWTSACLRTIRELLRPTMVVSS